MVDRIVDPEVAVAKGAPRYKISTLAAVFFAKTAHWIRWREKMGHLTTDDGVVLGDRVSPTDDPAFARREYTLDVIEDIINLLHAKGSITDHRHRLALEMVRLQAEIYGMFDEPYEYGDKPYPLSVEDVAKVAERSPTWVRQNALALGGVKRQWDESVMQDSWRFPEEGLDEAIHEVLYNLPSTNIT